MRADVINVAPQLLGSLRKAPSRGDRDRKLRMGCQGRAAFQAAGQHQLFTGDCPQNSRGAATVLKGASNLQDSHALRRACQSELGLRIQVL